MRQNILCEKSPLETNMLSIIVPVYNVAPYLNQCAQSLFAQTYPDIEFIFVDDASPDDSIEILQRVIEDYPQRKNQIRILHNPQNKGLAATRFVGIDAAKGDYILNVDSDDWTEPTMVEEMMQAAIKSNADMVCCNIIKECPDHQEVLSYDCDEETFENGLFSMNFREHHISLCNKLIRKSLFTDNNIRNYPGINMGEDSALTVRLRYFSRKTVIVHKAFYHYNLSRLDSMVAEISEDKVRERIELAKRIEGFFEKRGEKERFRKVINFYKFQSKDWYLRDRHDLRKWASIYPECHRDIPHFRTLTRLGRLKWILAAWTGAALQFLTVEQ